MGYGCCCCHRVCLIYVTMAMVTVTINMLTHCSMLSHVVMCSRAPSIARWLARWLVCFDFVDHVLLSVSPLSSWRSRSDCHSWMISPVTVEWFLQTFWFVRGVVITHASSSSPYVTTEFWSCPYCFIWMQWNDWKITNLTFCVTLFFCAYGKCCMSMFVATDFVIENTRFINSLKLNS